VILHRSVAAGDPAVQRELLRGVAQIRATKPDGRRVLQASLARTLAALRRTRGSTPAGRRAKELAIRGFESTLKGVQSQLDFVDNDRGNIEAATRDAKRADRFLSLGADRLRAAGRALGLRIGEINGY
jgi:hypothetical protein